MMVKSLPLYAPVPVIMSLYIHLTKNAELSKTDESTLVFRTFVDSLLPGKKWCYNDSTGNTEGKKGVIRDGCTSLDGFERGS